MDMERLVELRAAVGRLFYGDDRCFEDYDFLIKNIESLLKENASLRARLDKAVELPLNIGDTVYRKGRFSDRLVKAEVRQIVKSKFGLTFKAERGDNTYFSFDEEDIGERIFLTEAEAQAKLDEMKGGAVDAT